MAPPVFSPINTIMKYNARKLVQSMLCEKLFLILATNTLCSTHDLQEARTKKDVFLDSSLPLDGPQRFFSPINTIMKYNATKLLQRTHCEKCVSRSRNGNRCLLVFILPLDGVHVCHE